MCRSPHPLRQSPFRRKTERCSADTAYAETAFARADRPEPAWAVVGAAFGTCGEYEAAFRRVVQPFQPEAVDKFNSEKMVPDLLVRVMVFRAVLKKLRNEAWDGPPI